MQMQRRMLIGMTFAGGLGSLGLVGCGGSDPQEIAFSELLQTGHKFAAADDTSSRYFVIRQQTRWLAFWSELGESTQGRPQATVDFARQTVIAVSLGMRPNGCYAVKGSSAKELDGRVTFVYGEVKPRPGLGCTQAVTYPLGIYLLEASGLPIDVVAGELLDP